MANFHTNTEEGISLTDGNRTATREDGKGSGLVFSLDPLVSGDKVTLTVEDKGSVGKELTTQTGWLLLGVTGRDPALYKNEWIRYIPQTWGLDTQGALYHGWRKSKGVCRAWAVGKGDAVTLSWRNSLVTVQKDGDILHTWEVKVKSRVWLVLNLDLGMKVTIT